MLLHLMGARTFRVDYQSAIQPDPDTVVTSAVEDRFPRVDRFNRRKRLADRPLPSPQKATERHHAGLVGSSALPGESALAARIGFVQIDRPVAEPGETRFHRGRLIE